MKNFMLVILILVPFIGLFAQQEYEPGVILLQVHQPEMVNLHDGRIINGSLQLRSVFQQYPVNSIEKLPHISAQTDGFYRIEFPNDFPLESIRDAISDCPEIKYITMNYYGVYCGEPEDDLWEYQWALQKIKIEKAWDVAKPNTEILVGILDSGLDYTHEDLIDNVWQNLGEDADNDGHTLEYIGGQWVLDPGDINGIDDDDLDNDPNTFIDDLIGWDFDGNDNNPQEISTNHGTRVSGVIAARTYNQIGIAGIAGGWENQVGVRLIGLGIGHQGGWDQIRAGKALLYLIKLRQQYGYTILVNMSFQTTGNYDEPPNYLIGRVNEARDAGIIMIAAAGNTQERGPYQQPEVYVLPYPARLYGVLAIGASKDGSTLQNERRSGYSLYDTEPLKLLVVAPVDTCYTTGINLYTTYPGDDYVSTFNGTSAACPIAVGVTSLILSANSSLSYTNISDIFKYTSEKIGNYSYDSDGRTEQVGYGRINAYQAVLMALAYDNKTPNSIPTIFNNERILARGKNNSDYLYEVFYSGTTDNYEIFFRRSTNDGTDWGAPVRISAGDENNFLPCISVTDEGTYDGVHVVWQRKKSNGNYQVLYRKSTNSGATWADQDTLPDAGDVSVGYYQSWGPMPVITWVTPASGYRLLVVYGASDGFHWRYKNSNGSWTKPNPDILPTPSGCSSNCAWFPSLMGERGWASLTFDYRSSYGVYSRVYTASTGTWSDSVSICNDVFTTVHDRHSQTAIAPDGTVLASWCAAKSGDGYYRILYREGTSNNKWSNQYHEFAKIDDYKHAYYPSITYFDSSGTSGIAIAYRTSDNQVRLNKSTNPPSAWQFYTMPSNTNCSNILHESGTDTPWIIWTNISSSPYEIEIDNGNDHLPKVAQKPSILYHRRIAVGDKENHTALCLEIGEIEAVTTNGEILPIAFCSVPEGKLNMTLSDFTKYLTTKTVTLPNDVEELRFYAEVYTTAPQDTGKTKPKTPYKDVIIGFSVEDFLSGRAISTSQRFKDDNGWIRNMETKKLDIRSLAGKTVTLKPLISGLQMDEKNLGFSLGHIWLEQDAKMEKSTTLQSESLVPKEWALLQNFPNPGNPTTSIRFLMPEADRVSLRIFNIKGQEIRTLVDDYREAGAYTEVWNGRDNRGLGVPSGIYLYALQVGNKVFTKKLTLLK